MARAFVGKAVYNHPHTRATIEALRASPVLRRICGFVRRTDVPSESTFSRAFAEFARMGLGERVHGALVERWVKPELVGHISRDATAIRGREKPTARVKPPKPAPRKKGPRAAGGGASPETGDAFGAPVPADGRRRPWRSCRCTVTWGRTRTPRVISRPG